MSNKSRFYTMTREELEKCHAELQRQVTELTALQDWLMKELQLNEEDLPAHLRRGLDRPRIQESGLSPGGNGSTSAAGVPSDGRGRHNEKAR